MADNLLVVLIADDHPIVREGVRNVLRGAARFAVPEEAATRDETLAIVLAVRLDVVVMNTTLLDADSIDVLKSIKLLKPDLPVIMLHPTPDVEFARLALSNGASGIITKEDGEGELVSAILAAADAGEYICAAITALMNGKRGLATAT